MVKSQRMMAWSCELNSILTDALAEVAPVAAPAVAVEAKKRQAQSWD